MSALGAAHRERVRQESLDQLKAMSREPFRDVLAEWLAHRPTPASIRRLAIRNPDRWGQGVALLARAAGYTERLEVEGTVRVVDLSDGELDARLMALLLDPGVQALLAARGAGPLPLPSPAGRP